jgi:hypothetical protein
MIKAMTIKPLELAKMFHEQYERLASRYGYETRDETKIFDPESSNGKLMIAVCNCILAELNMHDGG